jgi:hypothetical protein
MSFANLEDIRAGFASLSSDFYYSMPFPTEPNLLWLLPSNPLYRHALYVCPNGRSLPWAGVQPLPSPVCRLPGGLPAVTLSVVFGGWMAVGFLVKITLRVF